MPESLFNKVAGLRPVTLLKKRLWQLVLSCEFCEISKNTFLHRTPLVAASVNNVRTSNLRKFLEAVARRCSIKKVFLKFFLNSQENTCTGVSFLIKLQG